MFAKIPQHLAAPFGILGDEAKLAFPTQPNGIIRLSTVRNISPNDSYWDQYFVLFDSASEAFSLITPYHIRRALHDAPENVATLIQVVTSRLFNLISDHTFPSPPNASVTAFASSLIRAGTSSADRNTTKEVLNCLRILQRVLPVIFEIEGESNAFELELLWKRKDVGDYPSQASGPPETPQFIIEDEDENETGATGQSPQTQKPKRHLPSLAEKLLSSITDLLYCCGFTLPNKIQVNHHKINYVIWEKGIGSSADLGISHAFENNKVEVLRLLLVLLSRQIYVNPASLFSKPSLYTLHVVQRTPRRDVLTILCSLLNTAMNSSVSANHSIGGMAGSVAGKLPYNHLVFKGEDSKSTLVGICLQVLCVLLDFQSGTARDVTAEGESGHGRTPTARTNAFRYFLAKLHRSQDFQFILDGLFGILEQQMAVANNLLPGAKKSIPFLTETIIFLWKMIELNKKFCAFLLQSEKCTDLVAFLLCYAIDIKDKPQQHGLMRALSYIVQTFSAEPLFGPRLSDVVKAHLPVRWAAGGTLADLMINAVYAIVATTSGTLNSLYPALIIALVNASPHLRNLNVVASTRLLQLFTSFSNPLFLLSDEGHPRLVFFMLELFNSVILYNPVENPNFIYAVLTAHKTFEDLGTFTLSRGLREIRRVQLAKEDQAGKPEENAREKREAGYDGYANVHSVVKVRPGRVNQNPTARSSSTDNLAGAFKPDRRGDSDDLTSPSVTHEVTHDIPATSSATPSEKVRGKGKERMSPTLDGNQSLDSISVIGVGRNGFVPTQEWVTSWHQGLPLDPVMILISEVLPKVQDLQATTRHRVNSSPSISNVLSSLNLQSVMPDAPAPVARRFIWSDASIIWLTSLIWGEIYVRGMTPLGIWNGTNVRLFTVKHTQTPSRQITEAVSNVVGGLLRRNSDSSQSWSRS